jgi:membrane-associated phospholipid phosphatase
MGIGLPEIFIVLVLFPATLLLGIFWAWMLVDCATKEPDPDRLVWVIIIVFTNILGAALYYFIQRPRRLRTA